MLKIILISAIVLYSGFVIYKGIKNIKQGKCSCSCSSCSRSCPDKKTNKK